MRPLIRLLCSAVLLLVLGSCANNISPGVQAQPSSDFSQLTPDQQAQVTAAFMAAVCDPSSDGCMQ